MATMAIGCTHLEQSAGSHSDTPGPARRGVARARSSRLPLLVALVASAVSPGAARVAAAEPVLKVAIQTDLPPYVMHGARDGLEVEIVRDALAGRTLEFVQMPYAQLEQAVADKRAPVAVAVKQLEKADGVFYSREFVTFTNAAIAKKSAGLKIADVADLSGHEILAWQDAYLELGPVFEKLYAPDGPQRKRYVEFGDQVEQVRAFWARSDAVVVIDRAVFRAFSEELGHSMDDVDAHAIFAPVTTFRVAFADAALRDAFDDGIVALCKSGAYARILARYAVALPRTVCAG